MKQTFKKIAAGIAVFLLLFVVAHKLIIANTIKNIFEAHGLDALQLSVGHAGINELVLRDILVGEKDPLEIPEVRLRYSLGGALHGRAESIVISDAVIDVTVGKNGLSVHGLENFFSQPAPNYVPDFLIHGDRFFFTALDVENGKLLIHGNDINITVTFTLKVRKGKDVLLTFASKSAAGTYRGGYLKTEAIHLDAALDTAKSVWQGSWGSDAVSWHSGRFDIANMKTTGELRAQASSVTVSAAFKGVSSPIEAAALLILKPKNASFVIQSVVFPWAGGVLSARNAGLPIEKGDQTNANINVNGVAADAVLQLLSGGRMRGEGMLSGNVPVGILEDGAVIFYPGALHSNGAGLLSVPTEMVTNAVPKSLLRGSDIKDFHYQSLNIAFSSAEGAQVVTDITVNGSVGTKSRTAHAQLAITLEEDMLGVFKQSLISGPQH